MNLLNKVIEWDSLAEKAIHGSRVLLEEGIAVLEADDEELLPIMQASFRVRHHFYEKSKAQHDHQCQKWPMPGGLRLLLTIYRIHGACEQVQYVGQGITVGWS